MVFLKPLPVVIAILQELDRDQKKRPPHSSMAKHRVCVRLSSKDASLSPLPIGVQPTDKACRPTFYSLGSVHMGQWYILSLISFLMFVLFFMHTSITSLVALLLLYILIVYRGLSQ